MLSDKEKLAIRQRLAEHWRKSSKEDEEHLRTLLNGLEFTIGPCDEKAPIPADARCQEASIFSRESYVPCSKPAVAIVRHEKDQRAYYMCAPCADHNVRNRGGKLIRESS